MASAASGPARAVGFNLGVIMVVLALGGLAVAYGIDALARANRAPAPVVADATLTRTLGGRDFEIPVSWFRFEEQRTEGFAKQIDLQFMLPLGPAEALRPIEVTLLPRSSVRASAGLLDAVYLHLFEPGQLEGPAGLVGKPMRAEGGYAGETVWYDPLSGAPFVAKCGAPLREGGASRCLRAVHLAPGIGAVYLFDFDVLGHWRDFDNEISALFGQIGLDRR